MKLRKGDTVIVISGGNSKRSNDKGKVGEILAVDEKHNKVLVQGVNVVVKHKKPTQQNTEGSIETHEAYIDASNVAYYDSKAKERVKIGFATIGGKKVRINKKTGLELGKKAPKAKVEEKVVEAKAEEVKEAQTAKKTTTAAKKPAATKTVKEEAK